MTSTKEGVTIDSHENGPFNELEEMRGHESSIKRRSIVQSEPCRWTGNPPSGHTLSSLKMHYRLMRTYGQVLLSFPLHREQ